MPRWIAWIHDAQEKGTTIPVVPSTDSPPTMPSRAFIVLRARRSPPGIASVTVRSGGGAPFEPMEGRAMKEWLALAPEAGVERWKALAAEARAFVAGSG